MGKKLDLSRLTDEEARHVWDVVWRDLELRRKEEERLRVVKSGSLEWYYGHVRARFKRFGGAKVMRSLRGRLPGGGGPQPGPAEGSGDAEQTDSDGEPAAAAQARPPGRTPVPAEKKRLLPVHSLDFEADSDESSPPGGRSPSLQVLAGEPGAEEAGAGAAGRRPHAEERTDGGAPAGRGALAGLSPPGQACAGDPGVTATPGTHVAGSEPPAPQYLADVDTSDEDSVRGLRAACRPWERRGRPRCERQRPAPGEPAAADLEEDTLKRKLEELTSTVGDQGASSEEEGEDGGAELGRSSPAEDFPGPAPEVPSGAPLPQVRPAAGHTRRWEKSPPGPRDPVRPTRTADEELSALEDRVAATASEVQQAQSEVSDIESRIEALRAAGLAVQPAGRPQRSQLPILLPRLAGPVGRSPKDPTADASDGVQVVAAAYAPRRKPSDPPKSQGGSLDRESVYRGSLTQRSPGSWRGAAQHSLTKPGTTHKP